MDEKYVQIPPELLSDEALDGLIENFVLREGTDYGHSEPSLDDKKARVRKQLQAQRILIAYSAEDESCTLLTKEEFKNAQKS